MGRIFLLFFVLSLPVIFELSMSKGLNHDEHQHVAAGVLIAREGLLPYRDFPHFHTPYLPLVYSIIFRFTDHLLLGARMVSVVCGAGIVALLGAAAYGLFRERGRLFAFLISGAAMLICLTTPTFTQATGCAWNHEPGLFFAFAAFLVHLRGLRPVRLGWLAASGALLGVAIGMRITYAPLVAPFGLALLLFSPPPRWQPRAILAFGLGLIAGLAPLFAMVSLAPGQAWFSIFEFAGINVHFRLVRGEDPLTAGRRFRYIFRLATQSEIIILILSAVPVLAAFWVGRGWKSPRRFELWFLLLTIPFLLMGVLAPTPLHPQYFSPLVPFLLLTGLYALADIPVESPWFRGTWILGAVGTVVSIYFGRTPYQSLPKYLHGKEWAAMKIHRRSQELLGHVPTGRVLSLAPIYALEAKLRIYPGFSTGPFAWRVSGYIDATQAATHGIVTPETLPALLDAHPPAAIIVGFQERGEKFLAGYGKRNGYTKLEMPDKTTIWKPARQP